MTSRHDDVIDQHLHALICGFRRDECFGNLSEEGDDTESEFHIGEVTANADWGIRVSETR